MAGAKKGIQYRAAENLKPSRKTKPKSWNDVIDDLINKNTRHIIRRSKQTPYLQIRDKLTNKKFSITSIISTPFIIIS